MSTRLEELADLRRRIDLEIHREVSYQARMDTIREKAAATLKVEPSELIARTVTAVADAYDLTPADVLSRSRAGNTATARHIIMWILREEGLSYPEIGRAVGRDHTTALASVRRVQNSRRLLAAAGEVRRRVESAVA